MRERTRLGFLSLGFDTELIEKISNCGLTISGLKGMGKEALLKLGFSATETKLIREKVNRKPIPDDNLNLLLDKSGGSCCYCEDGDTTRPYQIHHIHEYASSQDHSEANLLLICPNHHVNIHATKLSISEQIAKKRSWENLQSVAKSYQQRSISFPFGAFEAVDYLIPGELTEVFSFGPPRPSVCRLISRGTVMDDAIQVLDEQNKIILSGSSGSGKTTLAIALAGNLDSYQVFKYVKGDKTSIGIAKEILLFLGLAQKKLVLIIDDANTKLQTEQIDKILQCAQVDKRIIIINTRNTLSSQQNLEQKYSNIVVPITWETIRPAVKANLLGSEAQVIAFLKDNDLDTFQTYRIGFSTLDRRLSEVLENYSKETDSVWQFIFMLASGNQKLRRIYQDLFAKNRLDLVVEYIGIKQISKVEAGVTLEEIRTLFSSHSKLNMRPVPSDEWLTETLAELSNLRILKASRDRFNLTHRRFALSFLEECFLQRRSDSAELYDPIFNNLNNVREIIILWSWLRDTTANFYLKAWRERLILADWIELGNKAAADGIFCLSQLSYYLHPGSEKLLNEILKDKAVTIAGYLNNPEIGTLYYFSYLATAIRYNCSGIWEELLSNVDQSIFAKEIKKAEPMMFDIIDRIFYSIQETHPQWIEEMSTHFRQNDFLKIIEKIARGKVNHLSNLVSFQRKYILDISKSDLVFYANKIGELLDNCPIPEINFPFFYDGIYELLAFPELIDQILIKLDPAKLALEFVSLTPQHWENLLSISYMSQYCDSTIIKDILSLIDVDKLISNIYAFYLDYKHEFRVIIYQLCHATSAKKHEFALAIAPLAKNVIQIDPVNKEIKYKDVLEALWTLDRDIAVTLCNELGIDSSAVTFEKHHSVDYEKIIEYIDDEERSGSDYLLASHRKSE